MTAPTANTLEAALLPYGVRNPRILSDGPSPETIDYLDLIPGGSGRIEPDAVLPEAVAERQGRPLLYVVNRAKLSGDLSINDQQFQRLRRALGSRGERAYLGILEPGQLSVMPISLEDKPPEAALYRKGAGEAHTFFSRLSMGEYDGTGEPGSADYVFDKMLSLLKHIADILVGRCRLDKDDVLSLIGRALFFRFLCDRKVVGQQSLRSVAPKAAKLRDCFQTSESAASTCAWLDRTFNGDFLPLSGKGDPAFFERLHQATKGEVFNQLHAILDHGELVEGGSYQPQFPWARFDFAHVPVGLLSQVYEAFSRKWSSDAKETSVHYTPRRIADYLVEEAFADLPSAASSRVLDPACGAGVFLVLAFRRLYQAKWKADGQRPDTDAIRKILENQLTGFEVSEAALRLTALSLYLTAIELDPKPTPPSKLGFHNLRGCVLFNCRKDDDPKEGPVIGSLGDHLGKNHSGAYDIVLCNPPWTALTDKEELKPLAAEYTRLSRDALKHRGLNDLAKDYENPDKTPDLPFVWRATQWCRNGGRIGMVLHGRMLFKQARIPRYARETLFNALAVNGILNCSNLADTPVWPKMYQPFLLLFAQNCCPKPNHLLRWVTPHYDSAVNRKGEVRIDSKSVELVSVQSAIEEPWLWKALSIGTSLDVELARKLKSASGNSLRRYWKSGLKLSSSTGYILNQEEPRSTQKPQDASHLQKLRDLADTSTFQFMVDTNQLPMFPWNVVERPRKPEVYRAPLALVKRFPGMLRNEGWALLSLEDVAYRENFFGYSGAGHPNGEDMVRYLQIFVHSYTWMHLVLVTGSKLGTERREFHKSVLDSCPFIPFETLNADQRKTARSLSNRLIALESKTVSDPKVFDEIDAFFAGLYGLSKHDAEVIRDTMETALPYKEVRERACKWPTSEERRRFAARLESSLKPFLRKLGKNIKVAPWPPAGPPDYTTPYSVVLVGTETHPARIDEEFFRDEILSLASESGASSVIQEVENGLAIGVLNQYRYWTPSRARLCAGQILLRHMAVFER